MKTLLTISLLLILAGCSLSTPTSHPNPSVKVDPAQTYWVVVTHAVLPEDSSQRKRFHQYVEAIEDTLGEQSGLVSFSKRAEILGDEVWTLTVWESEGEIALFSYTDVHGELLEDDPLMGAIGPARFARFQVKGTEIPVSWATALSELEANPIMHE
jgi:hypothetical protein